MRACNKNVTDYKKNIFDLIIRGEILDMTVQRNVPRFCSRHGAMDMAQLLERGALSMSLPAVRFRIPLGAGFSEKYHLSPLSILGHC